MKRWLTTISLLLAPALLTAQELTLDVAVDRALERSKGSQIMTAKTREAEAERRLAEKKRLPEVRVFGLATYDLEQTNLSVDRGDLNTLLDSAAVAAGLDPLTPILGPFPADELVLARGERVRSVVGLTVMQPLTQQWRIGSGITAAEAAAELAAVELENTRTQLREAVEKLWIGLRLESARHEAALARVQAREAQLVDARNAQAAGEVLDAAVLGAQAQLTEARTAELQSRQRREALVWHLADLIDWDRDSLGDAMITDSPLPERESRSLAAWLDAVEEHPEFRAAQATERRAEAGEAATRQERIPDVTAFATVSHQEGLPLLPNDVGTVGLALTWDPFDFGRRRAEAERSAAQSQQAALNRERVQEELSRSVQVAYQSWEHAQESVVLAREAESYRERLYSLEQDAVSAGEALPTAALTAKADWLEARTDRLGAELQAHLALLRLHALAGAL
ncbi:TolC family protein [Actomonas aquatica]|uniref:TolC family protein n=1 Tax=Actomonas aquatica TaxID=2866162 RepID=A0ABZ1C448_9BACT|nr:TolC family protein [Opitutus sp. WL0086]WRQ86073.1 TolC family protein [Opitutus sp. WL0086]